MPNSNENERDDFERRYVEITREGNAIRISVPSHWSESMIEQYTRWLADASRSDAWRQVRTS